MRILLLLGIIISLTACGVRGSLYRPSEAKPDPNTKTESDMTPFPDRPAAEQEVMPDLADQI